MITDSEMTYLEMEKAVKRRNVCAECGGQLTIAWGGSLGYQGHVLRCATDVNHKGIARAFNPSPYDLTDRETVGLRLRREKMVNQVTDNKSQQVMKYAGMQLTKETAMSLFKTIWSNCKDENAITRAAIISAQYGLNPLMRQIFLVPFEGKTGTKWEPILSIRATRLMARRKGTFSYLDNTPRIMTADEQINIFGAKDEGKIWVITKVRDSQGNTAQGYGNYPVHDKPYGTERGNTVFTMASYRSERQALDRLFPDTLPAGIESMDENIIDGNFEEVDTETGEIMESEQAVTPEPTGKKQTKAKQIPTTKQELLTWIFGHKVKAQVDQVASWITNPDTNGPYTRMEDLPDKPEVIKTAYGEIKNMQGWDD